MAFSVYNDAYYLLGAALGLSFPLYVAILVIGVITLIVALHRVDPPRVALAFEPKAPLRWVGGYLIVMGGGLAAIWLVQWAVFVATGRAPSVGPEAFRLIAALDLTLLCTLFVAGGLLLWRRAPWGFVLAPIAAIVAAAYTLVLAAGSLAGMEAGLPGMKEQLPIWGGLFLGSASSTWVLLRSVAANHQEGGWPALPGRDR